MLFQRYVIGIGIIVSLFGSSVLAGTGLTYHGRILKPDGSALESVGVQFTIQIRSPGNESCLLYQETQIVDMSDSGGAFSLEIGANPGFRVAAAIDGGYSLSKVFANNGTLTLPNCSFGSTYTPNTADGRLLYISFNDGSGTQTLRPQKITYVPYAVESMQLNGFTASQMLRVDSGTAPVLSAANLTTLNDLFNGTLPLGTGTVTNVTSLNTYLSITDNTTTPQLTVNVGTTAGTLAAGNDSRFTDSRPPSGTAGGDLGGTYPNPSLAKINGTPLSLGALGASQYLKYDGSNWTNAAIALADVTGLSTQLGNKIDASQLPANCAANQTLNFLAPTGTWTCANIALDAAAITSGTIAAARLPASATYWQDAGSGKIYYNAGNVGIGTTTPGGILDVVVDGSSTDIFVRSYRDHANHSKIHAIANRGLKAAPEALQVNDNVLEVLGRTFDSTSTNLNGLARMTIGAEAGHSDTSSPGFIIFATTPSGAVADTERMRITSAGFVGIGTTTPTAKLEVNGAIKIGTSNPIGRFTLCAKSSTTITTVIGENLYNWGAGDCNNGYPNNTCVGTISKSVVPGVEHNLAALGPAEKSHPSGSLTAGANGGFGFFTDTASAANGTLDIRVVYMCQN